MDDRYENDPEGTKENIQGYSPDFIIIPKEDPLNNNKNHRRENTSMEKINNKKKRNRDRSIFPYVALSLIFAIIGGLLGAAGVLYVAPQSENFKNTALYKTITEEKSKDYGPTTLREEKDALTVTEIIDKVGPAVVGVTTKSIKDYGIFGNQATEGIGSGFIINEEGYLLTNYHVINGAQDVKVILNDGKEVGAKVINYDAENDIAVVKIKEEMKMPGVVELGDSDSVQAGESVVAIGNPLGKEFLGTVTSGIVSAINRSINIGGKDLTLIQTDAAINPGNSGGPLLNSRGQVIGMNTAKINSQSAEGGVEGIGFSIPINQAKTKLGDLSKPILEIGIRGRDISENVSKENKIPVGVYVMEVIEFSPAEKVGIRPSDVITSFDGNKVNTMAELNKLKSQKNNGDEVSIEVYREGKSKTINLILQEKK
ncbi:S1C family serine protease [Clostridium algidicarnis]|uniref:S1C family serine protease n=1 Tax=Clostridium algidicarnis TaxID=37659 RepID=UPI001C0BBE3F|nr:trypsin-like peptidase domain-containing protein [Clostridium algidicarnis]MBU3196183.1 trypsin-like peptidase domain-containing protein [Clostridium algidicarnis]MBU3228874.1 trypsin-like peptidase domain-containing protein [Clostridium algidicarnis]MBU3252408.1 trypsin-like peptidase domain-containing protein [Clostridium algidicarnis]